jgi:hypothetical protein
MGPSWTSSVTELGADPIWAGFVPAGIWAGIVSDVATIPAQIANHNRRRTSESERAAEPVGVERARVVRRRAPGTRRGAAPIARGRWGQPRPREAQRRARDAEFDRRLDEMFADIVRTFRIWLP